jgi:hypothetical protein
MQAAIAAPVAAIWAAVAGAVLEATLQLEVWVLGVALAHRATPALVAAAVVALEVPVALPGVVAAVRGFLAQVRLVRVELIPVAAVVAALGAALGFPGGLEVFMGAAGAEPVMALALAILVAQVQFV